MTGISSQSSENKPKARYWRSLSELRENDDFVNDYLHREFPVAASEFPEGVSRRRWMKLMGASLSLAGVAATGCRYPEEQIAPFVVRPEGRIPGETYSRATNFELADRVYNLLISCVDGRPLKIEPNPQHPAGSGTDVFSQASILSLYDPDRSRGEDGFLLKKGAKRRYEVKWDEFETVGADLMAAAGAGEKMAVLMQPTASPSIVRMLGELKKKYPETTFARYDGAAGDAMRVATTKVFGKPAVQKLDLSKAKVVVALQADILGADRGQIQTSRTFAEHRDALADSMSRLYVVEGGYSSTGAAADCRLALRPSQMPAFLAKLRTMVAEIKGGSHQHESDSEGPFDAEDMTPEKRLNRFIDVLAHDIADLGDAVVVVGDALGADAIAAGINMNKELGSLGTLQSFSEAIDGALGETVSLGDVVTKMAAGEIETALILGGNPVFTAPGDIDVAAALGKVANTVYLGEYDDETGSICSWSLPLSHPLESWGDVVDADGNYGVCQPNILPLLGGRTVAEVLAGLLDADKKSGADITRATADVIAGKSLSEREWKQLLHDGYAKDILFKSELSATGQGEPLAGGELEAIGFDEIDQDDFEVIFVPADGIYDGRFANNGWLQELPQALTKMCWDNAGIMSPLTARELEIKHGDYVTLRIGDRKVQVPVYEMPGCAPGVVSVAIGYGRTKVGDVGGNASNDVDTVGVDVSPIRNSDAMLVAYEVEARPNYNRYEVAATQDHWAIDSGGQYETMERSKTLVREGTKELLDKVPKFATGTPKKAHVPQVGPNGSPWEEPMDMIKEDPDNSHVPQWGMSIDLSKCTGCNACVVACQSENNVPIVGREQVIESREMHWLRVDRYFQGTEENADIVQQPVACMHCETAPCEQVCPVAATVHTDEGINAMAYNRCIGTRYCANNCPFKVRRFNYFNFNEEVGTGYGINAFPGNIESANRQLQALVLNPEVTVRGRGVMEKCTYCVQRVEGAKITARKEGRSIRDGDVVTACQSACSSKAIEFGDISDSESRVAKAHADVRAYGMLEQLNVKPRTEYLARVRNTPHRLMTQQQLNDLVEVQPPHEGHHDDHSSKGDHPEGSGDHPEGPAKPHS